MQKTIRGASGWVAAGECVAGGALLWMIATCLTMSENRFLDLTAKLHDSGVAIAYLDGIGMWTAFMLLIRDLVRSRCKRMAVVGGVLFFVPALAANMLDFYTTIGQSPDLELETNTVWNSVKEVYGLQLALMFGFYGKIFLSLFAAVCFAFYLNNVNLLAPNDRTGIFKFITSIGSTCRTPAQRCRAIATMLAFYFAGMNLFCFYVAYANSLVSNLSELAKLPPLPAVIVMSLFVISIAFAICTYWCSRYGVLEAILLSAFGRHQGKP